MIFKGNTGIKSLKYGETDVKLVMCGERQIWPAGLQDVNSIIEIKTRAIPEGTTIACVSVNGATDKVSLSIQAGNSRERIIDYALENGANSPYINTIPEFPVKLPFAVNSGTRLSIRFQENVYGFRFNPDVSTGIVDTIYKVWCPTLRLANHLFYRQGGNSGTGEYDLSVNFDGLDGNTGIYLPGAYTTGSMFASSGLTNVPAGLFKDAGNLRGSPDPRAGYADPSGGTTGASSRVDSAICSSAWLFAGCSRLTAVSGNIFDKTVSASSLSGWNTGRKAIETPCFTAAFMFSGCSNLATVSDDIFKHKPNGTDFEYIVFGMCTDATWEGGLNDTLLTHTFRACVKLTQIGPVFGTAVGGQPNTLGLIRTFSNCQNLRIFSDAATENMDGADIWRTELLKPFSRLLNASFTFENCDHLYGYNNTTYDSVKQFPMLFYTGWQPYLVGGTYLFHGCWYTRGDINNIFRVSPTVPQFSRLPGYGNPGLSTAFSVMFAGYLSHVYALAASDNDVYRSYGYHHGGLFYGDGAAFKAKFAGVTFDPNWIQCNGVYTGPGFDLNDDLHNSPDFRAAVGADHGGQGWSDANAEKYLIEHQEYFNTDKGIAITG